MTASDDGDLKDAFKALGSSVRATQPSFQQLTSHAALNSARWGHRRRLATALAVVAVIPALFVLNLRPDRALDYERFTALTGIDLNEVTWEAPSDFLLDFPGRDLLRRVPVVQLQAPAPVLAPDSDSPRPPDSNDAKRRSRS